MALRIDNNMRPDYPISGMRDQILDELIWACLKQNPNTRPRAVELKTYVDALEMKYYGSLQSKLIVEKIQDQKDKYPIQYAKNPN